MSDLRDLDSTEKNVATIIMDLYNKYGSADYIGENITQFQHALQSGIYAMNDENLIKYDDFIQNNVIVAAMLHDIGHLVGLDTNADKMVNITDDNNSDNLGIINHEVIGANYLRGLGFPKFMCYLVEQHVAAKRYLCTINESYYNKLSDASKSTMGFQGGLMSKDEITKFKSGVYHDLCVSIRHYDDKAKRENYPAEKDLDYYTKVFSMKIQKVRSYANNQINE